MTQITIQLQDERIQAALAKLKQQINDLEPLLTAVGGELKKHIQLGFRNSQSPYGQAWAPLKVRQGKPLVDTGRLANSINYLVDANSVEVGTNVLYAALQQFGGTIAPKQAKALSFVVGGRRVFVKHGITIPARPFIPTAGLPPTWREGVLRIIERQLTVAD